MFEATRVHASAWGGGAIVDATLKDAWSWSIVEHVNDRDRIVRDPRVCGGEATIRGTRITLRTVLASLSDGDSIEDIMRDDPTLTTDDVRAVIAFAADSVREDLPAPKAVGF